MNGTVNEGENLPKWHVRIRKYCSGEKRDIPVTFVTAEALACSGVASSLRKCQLSLILRTGAGFGYEPDPLTPI
jgi:hypothetical protein